MKNIFKIAAGVEISMVRQDAGPYPEIRIGRIGIMRHLLCLFQKGGIGSRHFCLGGIFSKGYLKGALLHRYNLYVLQITKIAIIYDKKKARPDWLRLLY